MSNSNNHHTILLEPGYVTKPEAMQITGKSLKRFERAIRDYHIATKYVSVPGRRPMPTYSEHDLRVMAFKRTATVITPAPLDPPVTDLAAILRELLARNPPALPAPTTPTAAAAPLTDIAAKQLLTMTEAHRLGWPMDTLRELKRRHDPPGVRFGRRGFRFSAAALRTISANYSTEGDTRHVSDSGSD